MDQYHVWCDIKRGKDMDFARAVRAFLGNLQSGGKIESYRLTRRKLGLGPKGLGEFHIVIEVTGLAQLDDAFGTVATRSGEIEELHFGANSLVTDISFALMRDFPDDVREEGEEKF
ncbi:MAG: DUF6614 family protein [Alphaproteobacteria bacterium]